MPLLVGFSCLVRVDGLSLVYHMWLEVSSVLSVLSHLLYILGEVELSPSLLEACSVQITATANR